ncbi:MAG: NUDIX domain-containing protein [Armatimonadetes bacterium]|nr:NUDIX domain-containing protein [Armatimonadota bacterium]
MSGSIELIARAVIVVDGHVLLAHKKGAHTTFLPGGHIEFGEPAETALARELREELGLPVRVVRFLGAVEHGWTEPAGRVHELNLLFNAGAPALDGRTPVMSSEPHLEFFWQPMDRLAERHLEPWILCSVLPEWLGAGVFGGWASTLR